MNWELTCSTTELLRRLEPKAGLEPATTRVSSDNPILRPVENKANKFSEMLFADFLTAAFINAVAAVETQLLSRRDFGCSPVSVARPLLP